MKRFDNTKIGKKVAILGSLLAVTVFIGHGCSNFTAGSGGGVDSASTDGTIPMGNGGNTGEVVTGIVPAPGANTLSLVYNRQLLDNMVACTGTGAPSAAVLAEWASRQSSFSEYGYALDVTAPMMMAITAVAGEICDQMLSIETAQAMGAGGGRRLFNNWDFSQPSGNLTPAAVDDSARRFALSCFGRLEIPGANGEAVQFESELLNNAPLGAKESNTVAETRKLALIMCTAAISSLSGITL